MAKTGAGLTHALESPCAKGFTDVAEREPQVLNFIELLGLIAVLFQSANGLRLCARQWPHRDRR